MIVLSEEPFTAYKCIADQMTHYYFQGEHNVVHINRTVRLINRIGGPTPAKGAFSRHENGGLGGID